MRRIFVIAAMLVAVRAFADGPAPQQPDEPLADKLYDRAQALRAQGNLAESCKLFREAFRLNPNAIGALLNVARCDEESGKIRTAYREFSEARDRAIELHMDPQRDAAAQHLDGLADRIPHLMIKFAAPLPDNARIVVDEVGIGVDEAGNVLVDPGSVHVVVAAPGYVTFEAHVDIQEREHKTFEIPKLAPPVVVRNSRRFVGKVLAIVGGSAFVASAGLALGAKLDQRHEENETVSGAPACSRVNGTLICNPDVSNRINNDHTLGNLATGIGIAGLVVGAVGGYLWMFSPNLEQPHRVVVIPTVAPGEAGVSAAFRF
jgi:Tetratricopeptide repeat